MLREGAEKESRGWVYKELEFDLGIDNKEVVETEVLEKDIPMEGVQMDMFE